MVEREFIQYDINIGGNAQRSSEKILQSIKAAAEEGKKLGTKLDKQADFTRLEKFVTKVREGNKDFRQFIQTSKLGTKEIENNIEKANRAYQAQVKELDRIDRAIRRIRPIRKQLENRQRISSINAGERARLKLLQEEDKILQKQKATQSLKEQQLKSALRIWKDSKRAAEAVTKELQQQQHIALTTNRTRSFFTGKQLGEPGDGFLSSAFAGAGGFGGNFRKALAGAGGFFSLPSRDRIEEFNASWKRSRSVLRTVGLEGSDLLFTFRRLFGILAAFQAARVIFNSFKNAIKESVVAAGELETSVLGIASILTAVGDLSGTNKSAAGTALELAKNQRTARQEIEKIKIAALETSASVKDLVDAYQIALGPGLQAGFSLDQIRKFTTRISQVATAIDLPQNQLSEEVRSILEGTIQARTTRIAAVLGIGNEDIKRARELGTLYEFLEDRLAAFEVAGRKALDTFSARATNTRDAVRQLLVALSTAPGEAGNLGIFDNVKELLSDIRDAIVIQREFSESLEINPTALRTLNGLKVIIDTLVTNTRKLIGAVDTNKLITLVDTFGQLGKFLIDTVFSFLEKLLKTLVAARNLVVNIATQIRGSILKATGIDIFSEESRKFLIDFLSFTILLRTVISLAFGIARGFFEAGKGLFNVVHLLKSTVQLVTSANITWAAFTKGMLAAIIPLGIIVAFLGKGYQEAKRLEDQNKRTVITVREVMEIAALRLLDFVQSSLKTVLEFITVFVGKAINLINRKIKEAILGSQFVTDALEFVGIKVDPNSELFNIKAIEGIFEKSRKTASEGYDALIEMIGQREKEIGETSAYDSLVTTATNLKNTIFDLTTSLSGISGEQDTAADKFLNIADGISSATANASRLTEALDDINSRIRAAQDEQIIASGGSGGFTTALRQIVATRLELQEKNRDLINAERQAVGSIAQIETRRVALNRQIESLQKGAAAQVEIATKQAREARDANEKLNELITRREILQQKVISSKEKVLTDQEALTLRNEGIFLDNLIEKQEKIRDQATKSLNEYINSLSFSFDPEVAGQIERLAQQRLILEQELVGAEENKKKALEVQGQLNEKINTLISTRARALGLTIIQGLKEQTAELRAQINLLTAQNDIGIRAVIEPVVDTQNLTNEIQSAINKAVISRRQFNTNIDNLRITYSNADLETRFQLERQYQELLKNRTAEIELQTQEIRKQQIEFRKLQQRIETPITAGFREALLEFNTAAADTFQLVRDAISNILETTVNSVSDALVNAFDPDSNQELEDSIKNIGKAIQRETIEIFVRKSLASVFGNLFSQTNPLETGATALNGAALALNASSYNLQLAATSMQAAAAQLGSFQTFGPPAPAGFAKGGLVKPMLKIPSLAHLGAKGFALGGPSGRDPRDTIPAWLRPGEYVIRPEAVKLLGKSFLDKINSIHLPTTRIPEVRKSSFATGGMVDNRQSRNRQSSLSVSVMVPDKYTLDKIVAAGPEQNIAKYTRSRKL